MRVYASKHSTLGPVGSDLLRKTGPLTKRLLTGFRDVCSPHRDNMISHTDNEQEMQGGEEEQEEGEEGKGV